MKRNDAMKFRLGIVGLCTSHPGNWIPVIQQLDREGFCPVEIAAVWDSGETRPENYAFEFAAQTGLPEEVVVDSLSAMLPLVDGVIIHTANWDRHLEQAEPFLLAGKSVLLDKPVAGCRKDAAKIADWLKQGYRITGGSSLRYCRETADLLAMPENERGSIHTVYSAVGSDEFNYGIHGYSLICGLFGPGAESARFLGGADYRQIMLCWKNGKTAFLTLAGPAGLPFNAAVVTTKKIFHIQVDSSAIYRSMLKAELPYLTGMRENPPVSAESFLEPELLALAARESWQSGGRTIHLRDLHLNSPGYDGFAFADEYRRGRMKRKS